MTVLLLNFELLSAATFGRGDGVPGLVDTEVEHDEDGFPYLRGRTLRGLISEEMESLLYSLNAAAAAKLNKWTAVRDRLIGTSSRFLDETGILHVSDARLPEAVRLLIAFSRETYPEQVERLSRSAVLDALTAIRRQTAMSHLGAPDPTSLRALRVILPGTEFTARLTFDEAPDKYDRALLASTVLAWRRAGTGRNRGRGRLRAIIESEAWMQEQFRFFQTEVLGE